jgi:hypothetical protein
VKAALSELSLFLFLKELQELGDLANNFPPTPELERITYYPNYPVGPRGTLFLNFLQRKLKI